MGVSSWVAHRAAKQTQLLLPRGRAGMKYSMNAEGKARIGKKWLLKAVSMPMMPGVGLGICRVGHFRVPI
eukprot:scaffold128118_cov32-Tisochrysis_lutea.AAC.1